MGGGYSKGKVRRYRRLAPVRIKAAFLGTSSPSVIL
jgi:hypothetical protein